MKLIYYIIIRISLVLSVLLTGWAILFYFAVMDEVNDEVDDSLEDYSEIIIIRALAGEELPVTFPIKDLGDAQAEVVHSLAKVYIFLPLSTIVIIG